MKTAALFDLDGVVVDTEPYYTEFWKMIGMEYFPEDVDFASKIKGHTLTYIFDTYFAGNEERQVVVKQRLEEHQKGMSYPLVPGIIDFVKCLHEKGVGVAIVTSSDLAKMECLYREHPGFEELFDRIFTAEDALRSKPAPDCYLAAAQFFGLAARNCVVFEDSFNGLKAGRDSGAYLVGLSTSNEAAYLRDYCDKVIPDFSDGELLMKELFESRG